MVIRTRFDIDDEVIIKKERIKGKVQGIRIRGKGDVLVVMYDVCVVDTDGEWVGLGSRYYREEELWSYEKCEGEG